jgi:hypothetical protein
MPVLLLSATSGCAGGILAAAPPAADWSRESFRVTSTSCRSDNCRARLSTSQGKLEIRTRARTYAPHQIPGWERPRGERAVLSTALLAVRWLGGVSEHTRIGLGTRVVSGNAADGWELRCSVFWVDREQRQQNRRDGDTTSETERLAQGARCSAVATADTAGVRWRFLAGVAPPRDSLALLYDSLLAVRSPLIDPWPPMSLERLSAGGEVTERYTIASDLATFANFTIRVRLHVAREGGAALATFHGGDRSLLDVAPEATQEEAAVLRLVAAAVSLWLSPLAQ